MVGQLGALRKVLGLCCCIIFDQKVRKSMLLLQDAALLNQTNFLIENKILMSLERHRMNMKWE